MWLLENSVRIRMEQAMQSGIVPTAEQLAAHSISAGPTDSQILNVVGNNAEISIQGVLTKEPDFFARVFGGGNTTYTEIISALAEADSDPEVDNIVLSIDSPGGSIDGLFDTLAALQVATKPIFAVVSNIAASAAFALATQAKTIKATNRAVQFGSVGIVTVIHVFEDEKIITSKDAPAKAPDVTTAKGVAIVRKHLDDIHALFVEAIAKGRNTTVAKVNADFGQGGIVLADEALSKGMIDSVVGKPQLRIVERAETETAKSGGDELEVVGMNLSELRSQYPDLCAEMMQLGIAKERDRVTAHAIAGINTGAKDAALEAIQKGTEFTSAMQATYMTARISGDETAAALSDDENTAAALASTAKATEAGDMGDKVAVILEAGRGLEVM